MSEKAFGYVELSLFAFCKYYDGGLMRRVGGQGKGNAIWVCISMQV